MLNLLAQIEAPLRSPRVQEVPIGIADRIVDLGERISSLQEQQQALAGLVGRGDMPPMSRLEVLGGYLGVFVIAFVATLLVTPLMRRLAIANGVIDHPSDPRKVHRVPIAYLGGVAVFVGLMAGIFYSYLAIRIPGLIDWHPTQFLELGHPDPVRPSIVLGMFIIMMVGLLDDILKISPRIKIAGQLVAAAALAIDDVGVQVARGILSPIGKTFFHNSDLVFNIPIPHWVPIPTGDLRIDVIYWTGTAIIALFVLGACNASNLIDGLDGLLSGVTAICAAGLLVIALGLAIADTGARDSQRIVLCLAVLGACLGFLPHNFNPATIFLGDAGSLLLGFCTIVVILSLGDVGKTSYLVFAGLVIYSIPIIDTVLAIIRRKLAGKSISDADDQHLHHILKRMLGVKGAVFSLYGIGIGFAILGVAMSFGRPRAIYAITLVFAAFIVVSAIKIARKKQLGL